MDPFTAFLNALAAGFQFASKVVDGQSPAVREEFWRQWTKDWANIRVLVGIDKAGESIFTRPPASPLVTKEAEKK